MHISHYPSFAAKPHSYTLQTQCRAKHWESGKLSPSLHFYLKLCTFEASPAPSCAHVVVFVFGCFLRACGIPHPPFSVFITIAPHPFLQCPSFLLSFLPLFLFLFLFLFLSVTHTFTHSLPLPSSLPSLTHSLTLTLTLSGQ